MDLSSRKTKVEIFQNKGELNELLNPILTKVGSFYARVIYPTPKDAIATGTLAVVQYAQVFLLATDAKRLKIKTSMLVKIKGNFFEINGYPYEVYENNKMYVCVNASRKFDNG